MTKPQTVEDLGIYFKDNWHNVTDVTFHDQYDTDYMNTIKRFKDQEREEWYRGEHLWEYIGEATILIIRYFLPDSEEIQDVEAVVWV
jgi:hypothetical protein